MVKWPTSRPLERARPSPRTLQIQLEECRSKIHIGPPEEEYVLRSMMQWKDTAGNVPKEITKIIMDFSGHHAKPIFIETLFMQDVLSIFQDCILREHVIASGQTFDKTVLRTFSNFLEKECDFENNTKQRVAIDAEMRPLDWSTNTLKERIKVLDATVLGP